MKKIVAVFLLLFTVLTLYSCTTDSPPPANSDTTTPHQTELAETEPTENPRSRFYGWYRPYFTYEVGGGDRLTEDLVAGIAHKDEIDLSDERYFKALDNPAMQFLYNGNEYSLDYQYSLRGYQYQSDVDYYQYSKDGLLIKIGVNNDTGKLDRFTVADKDYLKKVNTAEKNHDECLNIAREYLGQYVEDPEEYVILVDNYLEIPEYKGTYDFEFVRMNALHPTGDRARIAVTKYGDIRSHVFSSLGSMRDAPAVNTIGDSPNMIALNGTEKINSVYSQITKDGRATWRITGEKAVFVRLDNGDYGLNTLVSVDVTVYHDDKTSSIFSDTVELFTYLGH